MKKLAFAIGLVMLGAVPANAQQSAPSPAGTVRSLCAADIQKLCAGTAPAEWHKCLMTNISNVSQDCGTALANAQSAAKEFHQACAADFRQYCGTQAAGPARHQCVVANTPRFSEPCQTALAAQHAPGK